MVINDLRGKGDKQKLGEKKGLILLAASYSEKLAVSFFF